jgi:hypothetical protein
MMTLVHRGDCSREQALISTVLWFSRYRLRSMEAEVQRLMNSA